MRQVLLGLLWLVTYMSSLPMLASDDLSMNDSKRYSYFFQEAARLQALGRYGDAFELSNTLVRSIHVLLRYTSISLSTICR